MSKCDKCGYEIGCGRDCDRCDKYNKWQREEIGRHFGFVCPWCEVDQDERSNEKVSECLESEDTVEMKCWHCGKPFEVSLHVEYYSQKPDRMFEEEP